MAVVSVAILISFHLKHQPTAIELRIAVPFGFLFWALALACLTSGLRDYIKTVNRYSRRQALVQSGVVTQVVSYRRLCWGSGALVDGDLGLYSCVLCYCSGVRLISIHECDEMTRSDTHVSKIFFPQCSCCSAGRTTHRTRSPVSERLTLSATTGPERSSMLCCLDAHQSQS